MQTILITGGAGFIGSHIVERYIRKGWRVVVVDDFSSGSRANLATVAESAALIVEEADIRDAAALDRIFAAYRPELVNHHAAQKSVAASVTEPLLDQEINGRGFLNVLLACGKYAVGNIVYASSGGALSKVITGTEKSKETDPPQLISPYAVHKYAGEKYLAMYASLYGFSYTVLRYANVYGPRQVPDGECGVIPIFVANIEAGRESVLMTYPDMPRGCSRDYVHVYDVARINELAGDTPTNTVLNVGTGEEIFILDIYEKLQAAWETDLPIRITGPREGDIRRSVLDASRAEELLGWRPSVGWEEGLRSIRAGE